MFIQHVNRCGDIYYLYQGITKTGKSKYFFSRKVKENRLNKIPNDFEIYESPEEAQVFLVKKAQSLITEKEKQIITAAIKKNQDLEYFIVDVKKNIITIYIASNELPDDIYFFNESINIQRFLRYMKEMRFILTDENKRYFEVERFCYRGSVDDWMNISGPDLLLQLAPKYIDCIGKESIYLPF